MRFPPTFALTGQALRVEAALLSGRPVRRAALRYRTPGASAWRTLPLRPAFRRTYRADIPSGALTEAGLEYYLEVEDAAGRKAYAPVGFPAVVWSVTGLLPSAPPPGSAPAPTAAPAAPANLRAEVSEGYEVTLSWEERPQNRGARYEVFRMQASPAVPLAMQPTAVTYFPPICDAVDKGGTVYTYRVIAVSPEGRRSPPAHIDVSVPRPPVPPSPSGLTAASGPGRIRLAWKAPERVGLRVRLYRAEGEAGEFHRVAERRSGEASSLVDAAAQIGVVYRYRLTAVDRGGQESAPGAVVSACPAPVPREPVFSASMEGSGEAQIVSGTLPGDLRAPARFRAGNSGSALDTRGGGYLAYPYNPAFDASGGFTALCRVKLDTQDGMPVIASCGEWERNGWFLQVIGGRFRFYLGRGNVLDAGRPETGRWVHLAATFDGSVMRLYQDGREMGRREVGVVEEQPWNRPLFIGHYHLLQSVYQMRGLIDEFRIYQRALSTEEIAADCGGG
jgi:hypothetical protein